MRGVRNLMRFVLSVPTAVVVIFIIIAVYFELSWVEHDKPNFNNSDILKKPDSIKYYDMTRKPKYIIHYKRDVMSDPL